MTSKKLRPEIGEKVTEDDQHDRPRAISERPIDVEDAQVEEQDGHLVAKKTDQPGERSDKDPPLVLLSKTLGKVPSVQTHAILSHNAGQSAVDDDEWIRGKRSVWTMLVAHPTCLEIWKLTVVPTYCTIDKDPCIHAHREEDGGEYTASDTSNDEIMRPTGHTFRK